LNIGDVFFELRGDGSGLQVDAKKAGEAAGASGAQSFRGSFDAKLKGLGMAGGIAGFGIAAGAKAFDMLGMSVSKAVDFMGDAVNAAMEDEASQAKLRTALEANVKGWDGNTKAIEDVITSRMKLGFSDSEQRDSLAVLVARTGDVTSALKIQGAAMDLARLKGIDLGAASKAIALGMGGQGRALKELGINVKDYANANEILAAIQAKASGQAEDYANTTAGAMAAERVAIDEAMEAIGFRLLPVVKTLAEFVRDNALPAVEALGGALDNLTGNTAKEVAGIQQTRDTLADFISGLLFGDEAAWKAARAQVGLEDAVAKTDVTMHGFADAATAGGGAVSGLAAEIVAGTVDIGRAYVKSTQASKLWIDDFRRDMQATAPALNTAKTDFEKFLDTLGIGPARAKLQGELTGAKLAAGLKTGTKASRAAGAELVKTLTDQLNGLDKPLSAAAQKAELEGELLTLNHARGIAKAAGDPTRMALIDTMIGGVRQKMIDLAGLSYTYGMNTGSAWSRGIVAAIQIANPQIGGAIKHVQGLFKATSPPGPESPLHEIDKWGARTGQTWVDNLVGSIAGGKAGIMGALGGLAMPGVAGGSFYAAQAPNFSAQAGSVSSTASTINRGGPTYNVNVTGLLRAETPDDIGRVLRRTAALGMTS
jgi:hypothetical protein